MIAIRRLACCAAPLILVIGLADAFALGRGFGGARFSGGGSVRYSGARSYGGSGSYSRSGSWSGQNTAGSASRSGSWGGGSGSATRSGSWSGQNTAGSASRSVDWNRSEGTATVNRSGSWSGENRSGSYSGSREYTYGGGSANWSGSGTYTRNTPNYGSVTRSGTASGYATRLPGGGVYRSATGPAGGQGAVVRGPYGRAVGGYRGPAGYGVAGYRGPYSSGLYVKMPAGSASIVARGTTYWYHGYSWYRPYWYGNQVYYRWVYPPVGYWYPSLPSEAVTVVYGGNNYYFYDGVYYTSTVRDNQSGYSIVDVPDGAPSRDGEQGIDPLATLKSVCDYLAGVARFRAVVSTTTDTVLDTGEKVLMQQQRTICVNRPNSMSADINADGDVKHFVFDGASLDMFDETRNVYTIINVPGSIEHMLDKVAHDYAVVMPFGDFLDADAYDKMAATITSAEFLGTEQIGNVECYHLAFTGDAVDWQLWVATGTQPLPHRIVVDHKLVAAKPRYTATIETWQENPSFAVGQFDFTPPPGAVRIEIAPAGATPTP